MDSKDLDIVIDKLEAKISYLLKIYNDQTIAIKQLKKENSELKHQLTIDRTSLDISDENRERISTYIQYIDKCIDFIKSKADE